jgi:4-hydroxybenzoate polyprenyltransferase
LTIDDISFYFNTALGLCRPIGIPVGIISMLAAIVSADGFSYSILPSAAWVTLVCYYVGFAPNDYFDGETDKQNPRKGGAQGEVVNSDKKKVAKWVSILSVVAALATAYFVPFTARVSLVALTALSLVYSAPPIRLKGVPFLDSVSNFVMAYVAFTVGVGMTGASFSEVIPGAFWFALIWGGGGHALGTVLDYEADKKAGIKTIAMKLGRKPVVALVQFLVLLALFFEQWSYETKLFHMITFWGLLLVAENPERKRVEWTAYAGTFALVVYGAFWVYLRI